MSTLNQYGSMKKIIEGVREVYLGLLSHHLPGEAFDRAREDEVTQVAFDGVAEQFLSLIAYAEVHAPGVVLSQGTGIIESWEETYERQRQYWGEHDKTPYILAELNARRAQAAGTAAAQSPAAPFKVVSITSPGYEGWANVIYTGPACEGLCIAMVPPYVAKDLREMIASVTPAGSKPDTSPGV